MHRLSHPRTMTTTDTPRTDARCRHKETWLISGGSYEWCYQCGALRKMMISYPPNSVTPITQWTRPTGNKGTNPHPMKKLKTHP
jgi:hypothetical protein